MWALIGPLDATVSRIATRTRLRRAIVATGLLVPFAIIVVTDDSIAQTAARGAGATLPAEQTAAVFTNREWQTPRFSWGDPNLEGTFTSRDMSGVPMERPEQFGTRQQLTPEEFRQRLEGGPGGLIAIAAGQDTEDRLQLSALDSAETGTRTFGYTSYVIDPPNGKIPPLTEEGKERQAGRQNGQANGPFYTT
jgi:hypothetical protein